MLCRSAIARAGPPSLEQVLGRSMHIPASRQSRILKTLTALPPDQRAAVPSIFPAGAKSAEATAADGPARSRAADDLRREEAAQREAEFVKPMAAARNTSQDLSSLLEATRSVGDWEGAAAAFADAIARDPEFFPSATQVRTLVAVAADEGAPLAPLERLVDAIGSRRDDGPAASPADPATSPDSPAQSPQGAGAQQAAAELISAFADVDAWASALRVLQWARLHGPVPDEATRPVYVAALQACEAGQRWEEALAIHREMASSRAASPDGAAYAALMAALEASQRTRETEAVARLMPPREADEVVASYSALVNTWSARHSKRSMRRF
uniref:Uncharacterized protein n=1 Tax=Neobodo designis TaxID=312471 RepID=A0A7S1LEW6_NEODS